MKSMKIERARMKNKKNLKPLKIILNVFEKMCAQINVLHNSRKMSQIFKIWDVSTLNMNYLTISAIKFQIKDLLT